MGQTLSGNISTKCFEIPLTSYNIEPNTTKNSQKIENELYSVGSSCMQGWRIRKYFNSIGSLI